VRTSDATLLAHRTTLRLGGPARRLVEAPTVAELVDEVSGADARGEPVLVLGGGSNVVIADEGFDGTVVPVAVRGVVVAAERQGRVVVTVAAGESWDALVARAVESGWVGVEALSGIPGLVGAVPIQNVGAYGQEVAETVVDVEVWDRTRRELRSLGPAECGFGYRTSRLKAEPDRFLVLAVTFRLRTGGTSAPVRYAELADALGIQVGEPAPVDQVRAAVLDLRRRKGMVLDGADRDTWSAGSFFTNPVLDPAAAAGLPAAAPRWSQPDGRVKTSAGWLIEHAGFGKGYGSQRVALSGKHPLAITNRGGGTTAELVGLAREIRAGVWQRYGVWLVNEPVLVGCSL
jgi:UDP-N-acetylmuramate dehydrogenase